MEETALDVVATVALDAYRAENEVIDRLNNRAEKYVAAIGVVLAYTVSRPEALPALAASAPKVIYASIVFVGLLTLVAALALAIDSLRVREYPTYPGSEAIMAIERASSNDLATRSVAAMHLELRDKIVAINEFRAGRLRVAGGLTVVGFLIDIAGLLMLQTR